MLHAVLHDSHHPQYGIFREDDMYIRKDFHTLVPTLAASHKVYQLDVFLLGYLEQTTIESTVPHQPEHFPATARQTVLWCRSHLLRSYI